MYLAEHLRLPRRDALKVLAVDVSADPGYRARFNREAELASKLWHPTSSVSMIGASTRASSGFQWRHRRPNHLGVGSGSRGGDDRSGDRGFPAECRVPSVAHERPVYTAEPACRGSMDLIRGRRNSRCHA